MNLIVNLDYHLIFIPITILTLCLLNIYDFYDLYNYHLIAFLYDICNGRKSKIYFPARSRSRDIAQDPLCTVTLRSTAKHAAATAAWPSS